MSDNSHPALIEEQDRSAEKTYSQSQHSTSKVNVDYFDPSGVQELRATLSRLSHSAGEIRKKSSRESDVTLANDDAPFDFEKTLKGFLNKSVHLPYFTDHSSLRSAGLMNPVSRSASLE